MSEWPIIQCPPGPTDAELEADRDAKHAVAVREWFAIEARRATAAVFAGVQSVAAGVVGQGVGADPADGQHAGVGGADVVGQRPRVGAQPVAADDGHRLGRDGAADSSQSGRFGVRYLLWRVPQHFNHVHITVN